MVNVCQLLLAVLPNRTTLPVDIWHLHREIWRDSDHDHQCTTYTLGAAIWYLLGRGAEELAKKNVCFRYFAKTKKFVFDQNKLCLIWWFWKKKFTSPESWNKSFTGNPPPPHKYQMATPYTCWRHDCVQYHIQYRVWVKCSKLNMRYFILLFYAGVTQ